MYLLPMPKNTVYTEGVLRDGAWALYAESVPTWVMAAYAPLTAEDGVVPLKVTCGEDAESERYRLAVTPEKITVTADGPKGAFYAAQTLRQLRVQGTVPCCEMEDEPALRYRGFYQDVSRGRIPTLETLKVLVDRLSECKMNSLQLYVEHTHRFKEYAGIQEELGFYTDEEILELDRYCRERCVELIPSLSSFGHLYVLLQSSSYRHLCEMEAYQPSVHNWHERLIHHTIDPTNPESVSLITSLIEQYLPLFTSPYFNICCDETFDLCKGRNRGGDTAALYASFVSKLARFLQGRGKTVMMWGDIVMQHPEALEMLPEGIVYLNWCYDANGNGLRADVLKEAGVRQIVCPSVHSHKRFLEKLAYSLPNIRNVTEQGLTNGADGVLLTNWGDYGHLCFDEGVLCGLVYGAAVAWNPTGLDDATFEKAVLTLCYHADEELLSLVRELNRRDELFLESFGYEKALWELTVQLFDNEYGAPKDYERHKADLRLLDLQEAQTACRRCAERLAAITAEGRVDTRIGEALTLAARGITAVFGVLEAEANDRPLDETLVAELCAWLADYKTLWHRRNKAGEWARVQDFFEHNILKKG